MTTAMPASADSPRSRPTASPASMHVNRSLLGSGLAPASSPVTNGVISDAGSRRSSAALSAAPRRARRARWRPTTCNSGQQIQTILPNPTTPPSPARRSSLPRRSAARSRSPGARPGVRQHAGRCRHRRADRGPADELRPHVHDLCRTLTGIHGAQLLRRRNCSSGSRSIELLMAVMLAIFLLGGLFAIIQSNKRAFTRRQRCHSSRTMSASRCPSCRRSRGRRVFLRIRRADRQRPFSAWLPFGSGRPGRRRDLGCGPRRRHDDGAVFRQPDDTIINCDGTGLRCPVRSTPISSASTR